MVSGSDGLDPRVADLVQREIDGANTKTESAELHDVVKRDPLARRTLEEFRGLARGLDGLASVAPPADLRRAVMHEITTRSQPPRRSEGGILAWLWPGRGPALRYAWIAVMAVGLGLVVTYWRTLNHIDVDAGSVSGALVPAGGDEGPMEWTIDTHGVTGTMRAVDDAAGFGIALDLSGSGPLGAVFDFDPAAARFAGIVGGAPEAVQAEDGRVRIMAASGRHITARFERLGGAGIALGVRLERAETVLQEWNIEFPGRQVQR